jgi:hypothetical protein
MADAPLPHDAVRALSEFMKTMKDASRMVASGDIGKDVADLLQFASELLDVADEAITGLDRHEHADVFDASRVMRHKLERMRDELRGDTLQ